MNRTHFWIPAVDPRAAEEELNRFVRAHRVVTTEESFVADGLRSAWAVSVCWLDGEHEPTSHTSKSKIDYREVLDEATFALFAVLRRRRRELAQAVGQPPYMVATNQQLAEISRRRARTLEQLRSIPGLGEARLEKYGHQLATWMAEALAETGQADTTDQATGAD